MSTAFARLVDLVRNVGEERASAGRELERLRLERAALDRLPLPKTDFKARLLAYIDSQSTAFDLNLKAIIEKLQSRPTHQFEDIPGGLPMLVSVNSPHGIDADVLTGLLFTTLKGRVAEVVENLEWPKAGPPFAARAAQRERLDAQILEVHEILDQINRGLSETGTAIGDTDGR